MSDTIKEEEFNADVFDSMVYGSFEPEEVEDESIVEEPAVAEDLDEDGSEDYEDTDQEDDSEEEEELDEDSDGDLDEDSDTDEEEDGENALVDDYDSDEEPNDTEEEEEEADDAEDSDEADITEDTEEVTDTEGPSDGEGQDTDEVDYKAFYDAVVNTEFAVNGKKVKGFADPQKIIQSQQMAGGFSEKMAGFKPYRPYMAPLKERGMLEDPTKFDLAMNLIDGDKEAIKQHLQSLNIDPMDLDMEKIDYSGKSAVASNEALILDDVMERAKGAGIEDRVRSVIGSEWDTESFQTFVSNDAVRNDLLSHIESGAYDAVQDKIAEMSRLDYNGAFGGMNSVNKYRAAVQELQKEAPTPVAAPVAPKAPVHKTVKKAPSVKAEKAKIQKARDEEVYKEKATKREAKVSQQRKRAASMSKKRVKPKPKAKFDPVMAEGADLDNLMEYLISSGGNIPTA